MAVTITVAGCCSMAVIITVTVCCCCCIRRRRRRHARPLLLRCHIHEMQAGRQDPGS